MVKYYVFVLEKSEGSRICGRESVDGRWSEHIKKCFNQIRICPQMVHLHRSSLDMYMNVKIRVYIYIYIYIYIYKLCSSVYVYTHAYIDV